METKRYTIYQGAKNLIGSSNLQNIILTINPQLIQNILSNGNFQCANCNFAKKRINLIYTKLRSNAALTKRSKLKFACTQPNHLHL